MNMYSFVFFKKKNVLDWHRFYGEELYDHSIDPNELINLHDRNEYQDLKLKLKKVLRDRIQ